MNTVAGATFKDFLKNSCRFYLFSSPKNSSSEIIFYTEAHFNLSKNYQNRVIEPFLHQLMRPIDSCSQIVVQDDEWVVGSNIYFLPVNIFQLLYKLFLIPISFRRVRSMLLRSHVQIFHNTTRKDIIKLVLLNIVVDFWVKEFKNRQKMLIILPIFYNFYAFSILRAAKMTGHKVIALQHGHNAEKHPAFFAINSISLPDANPWLPDEYLGWTKECIETLPIKFKSSVSCKTYEYLDFWKKQSQFTQRKFVLFTGQPSISLDNPLFVYALTSIIQSDFKVYFRPHPRQKISREDLLLKLNLDQLYEDNLTVDNSSTCLQMLQNAVLHITAFSSSIIEAAEADVLTIAFDRRAEQMVHSIANEKNLKIVETFYEFDIAWKQFKQQKDALFPESI